MFARSVCIHLKPNISGALTRQTEAGSKAAHKRSLRINNTAVMVLGGVLLASATAYPQGWQPEQLLFSGNGSSGDQTITCADFPNYAITTCVFEEGPGTADHLYESATTNGGLTWSAPAQITNDSYSECDCSIKPDFPRGRLSLMYSRSGVNGGNDMSTPGTRRARLLPDFLLRLLFRTDTITGTGACSSPQTATLSRLRRWRAPGAPDLLRSTTSGRRMEGSLGARGRTS